MKKILFILCLLFIFVSCSSKPAFDRDFPIETYDVDMSAYKGMTSSNHCFKGTTVAEVKRTIDEKGSGIFILSRIACSHCQLIISHLNNVAKELGVTVYYIDAESPVYPIIGTADYDLLYTYLYDILAENEGKKDLMTPHLFTIINGEFTSSLVGYPYENDLSEKAMAKLERTYKKMIKTFAE